MLYINDIKTLIDRIDYIIGNYIKTCGPDKSIQVKEDVKSKVIDIYKVLNISILSGEYLSVNDFELELSRIINETKDQFSQIYELLSSDTIFFNTINKVADCIIRDLQLYKFQIHYINKALKNPRLIFLNDDIINEENYSITDAYIPIHVYSEIFRCNYKLLCIDHDFILSNHIFDKLNIINHDLHDYKCRVNFDYIDAIIRKCELLLAKFNYKESIKKLQFYNYYKDTDTPISPIIDDSKLYSIIQKLYTSNESEYKSYVIKIYEEIKFENCDSFFKFFIKCHYYKNVAHNIDKLSDLIKEFIEYKKIIPTTDIYNYSNASSCLNYISNCRLSLYLKQEHINELDVWQEQLNIKNIQDKDAVRNYFPHMIIAEWYAKRLADVASQSNDISSINSLIYQLNKCINIADEYLNESKRNAGCFIPYKPSLDECIENYQLKSGEIVKIFVSSSYVIPVDYDKAEARIKKLQSEFIKFNTIFEARKSIDAIVNKIVDNNEKIEKNANQIKQTIHDEKKTIDIELKEAQKSTIQILAIFSGIVLFASGTIQIFTGAQTVKDAAIFMLLFASSILIISLSIWLITSHSKDWDSLKTIIVVIVIVLLIINIFAILGNWGNQVINSSC